MNALTDWTKVIKTTKSLVEQMEVISKQYQYWEQNESSTIIGIRVKAVQVYCKGSKEMLAKMKENGYHFRSSQYKQDGSNQRPLVSASK